MNKGYHYENKKNLTWVKYQRKYAHTKNKDNPWN